MRVIYPSLKTHFAHETLPPLRNQQGRVLDFRARIEGPSRNVLASGRQNLIDETESTVAYSPN
jgi:hypothetical protein